MEGATFDYAKLSAKVKIVFREALKPEVIVTTSEGYLGRVHVKVISPVFDGRGEQEKQAYVWEILNAHLSDEERLGVTLVVPYGTDELP